MPTIELMIIGAEKAGTTSLMRYLAQHPAIHAPSEMEMNFFAVEREYRQGYAHAFRRYFGTARAGALVAAKSAAILDFPLAARRLREHNPAMRLVALLRHPVDRAWSAYWYARRHEWETIPTFEAAIAAEETAGPPVEQPPLFSRRYLSRGKYSRHLEALFSCFPRDQVEIVLLEELKRDPEEVCRRIWSACGLPPATLAATGRHNGAALPRWPILARWINRPGPVKRLLRAAVPDTLASRLRTLLLRMNEREAQIPPLDPRTRRRLCAYFQPYNQELAQLLGRDLDRWNE